MGCIHHTYTHLMNKTCRLSACPQTNALFVWELVYCVENYIVMYECDINASVVGVHNSEIIHISKPQSNDTYYHVYTHEHSYRYLLHVRILQNVFFFFFKCSDNLNQIFSKTKQTNKQKKATLITVYFHHLVLQHVQILNRM